MNVDFSLILVLLVALSGVICLLGMLFKQSASWPVEYARSFFPLLLLVLVLRSFIFEPFRIPSGSMKPTLLIGDFILVNKFAYGVRLPVIHKKVLDIGKPERGDVAVFRFPRDQNLDYIKRIVGLPGDQIQYRDKTLTVNGIVAAQDLIGEYDDPDGGREAIIEKTETLDDLSHQILISTSRNNGNELEFTVPEGTYFAVGDNRDNSNDSRYWGPVPEENLVGKAFLVWMHFNWDNGGVKWSRLGDRIK